MGKPTAGEKSLFQRMRTLWPLGRIRSLNQKVSLLEERLEEEMTIRDLRAEDRGWITLFGAGEEKDLNEADYRKMHLRSFEAWKVNPLARLWVNLTTWFVVDEGLTFECPYDDTGEIKKALDEFRERNDIGGMEQRLCDHLQIFGEAFIGIFVSGNRLDEAGEVLTPGDGSVQLVEIDPLQIAEIIKDKDTGRPLYYRREYRIKNWKRDLTSFEEQTREEIIADYANPDPGEDIRNLRRDMVIFHVKRNAVAGMSRGISDLYPALDWLRAYKVWLEDRLRINKARGMYVWKKKVFGGALEPDIAAGVETDRGRKPGLWTRNPRPPAAGSVIVENQNVSWEMIANSVNAADASEDGRAFKLMVCAAAAMGEHFFSDAKVGNLASTKSMELPAKKKFLSYRKTLTRAFETLFAIALEAVKANTTRFDNLPGEAFGVHVNYPPLVKMEAEDLDLWMNAMEKQINLELISRQNVMEQIPQIKDVEEERRRIGEEKAGGSAEVNS